MAWETGINLVTSRPRGIVRVSHGAGAVDHRDCQAGECRAGVCQSYPSTQLPHGCMTVQAFRLLAPLGWPVPSPELCLPVLCVGDVFHPVDRLSVKALLDGYVCHARRRCCSVPVLFAGREPDHVARANLLDWPALSLHPAAARRHHQSLAERMCMLCCPRAWLECHGSTRDTCRSRRLE